jgi:hypothetical protein
MGDYGFGRRCVGHSLVSNDFMQGMILVTSVWLGRAVVMILNFRILDTVLQYAGLCPT